MSFFRNIRSSITRGKSSSRDTTPVRAAPSSRGSSRPGSVLSHSDTGRRDSLDSRADSSILNRGETFILNSDQEEQQRNSSNSSTLEKKSKKSKVLSKFSTFTKRKKTPPQSAAACVGDSAAAASFEHHPSDNATNTYYKWNADGTGGGGAGGGVGASLDYDAHSDPFNFLYEQHSSLKLLQNGIDSTDVKEKQKNHGFFDSSTYRKGKATSQLKAQLEQLKTQQSNSGSELHEEEQEPESEKYKTVTLNSFRKSFRDKYLQQQHEAPHNPAWFVEVEAPAKHADAHGRQDAKENRPDFLVFENDNYRPGSRSPVRERTVSSEGRQSRSTTRSPVKRNETFRVERSALDAAAATTKPHINAMPTTTSVQGPSIRVEIKNSVMPRAASGRIVPVGVAKPMPSTHQHSNNNNSNAYFRTPLSTTYNATTSLAPSRPKAATSTSPQRNSLKTNAGKYQTLVQISNNHMNGEGNTKPTTAPAFNRRNNRSNSTRIQLVGGAVGLNALSSSNKFNNNIGSRYSYAAPMSTHAPMHGLSSYELLRESSTKLPLATQQQQQRPKQIYFGGDIATTQQPHQPTQQRLMMSPAAANATTIRTTLPSFGNNHHNYNSSSGGHITSLASNTANTKQRQHQTSHSPKRSSSTTLTVGPISGYMNRRDLHQPRFTPVPVVQRRSRSPIKMPWR